MTAAAGGNGLVGVGLVMAVVMVLCWVLSGGRQPPWATPIPHLLVGVPAAVVALIDRPDSDLAGLVIVGAGGAGAAVLARAGSLELGAERATDIWLAAGIGLACGYGLLAEAAIATALRWGCTFVLPRSRPTDRAAGPD